MDFSTKLKEQRTAHKLSQEQLADKLHIARQSISKWERGEAYPSIGMLLQLSELFDVSVDDLLKGDEYLKSKIVKDGEKLKHPRLKSLFEWLFMTGLTLLIVRATVTGLVHFGVVDWDIQLIQGWPISLFTIALMVTSGIAIEELGKIKQK